MEKMTPEKALEMFGQGFDCSQVVLSYISDRIGISKEAALKSAAAFGGGMWKGETCGCVVSGLIAVGMAYGTDIPNDTDRKNLMLAKKSEFEKKFCDKYKSCICREILGHDLTVPEEMAKIQEKKLLQTLCPEIVCATCEILDGML